VSKNGGKPVLEGTKRVSQSSQNGVFSKVLKVLKVLKFNFEGQPCGNLGGVNLQKGF